MEHKRQKKIEKRMSMEQLDRFDKRDIVKRQKKIEKRMSMEQLERFDKRDIVKRQKKIEKRMSMEQLDRFDKRDIVLFDFEVCRDQSNTDLCEFASLPLLGDEANFHYYISTTCVGDERTLYEATWDSNTYTFDNCPRVWRDLRKTAEGKIVLVHGSKKASFLRRVLSARQVVAVKNLPVTQERGRCTFHRCRPGMVCSSNTVWWIKECLTGDRSPDTWDIPFRHDDVLEGIVPYDGSLNFNSEIDILSKDLVDRWKCADIVLFDEHVHFGAMAGETTFMNEVAVLPLAKGGGGGGGGSSSNQMYHHCSTKFVGANCRSPLYDAVLSRCYEARTTAEEMTSGKVVLVAGTEKAKSLREVLVGARHVYSVWDLPALAGEERVCPQHKDTDECGDGGDVWCSVNIVLFMRDVLTKRLGSK